MLVQARTQLTPTTGDNRSCLASSNRFDQNIGQRLWVINNNATETNIYRWWTTSQEIVQFRIRGIIWFFSEEETAHVLIVLVFYST